MRKVTMVVPVLITSCQVSLKPNSGPVTNQTTITAAASMKVLGRPLVRAMLFAKLEYQARLFMLKFLL